MRVLRTNCIYALVLSAGFTLSERQAFPQSRIVGAVSGTVKDPAGAAVPSAKVALRDEGTGITKEQNSNEQGSFLFPDLSHGSFGITVTAPGFETAVVQHIQVAASQTTDLVVNMKVGQISESVTVAGVTEPVLETTSNLTGTTLTEKDIAELPIIGRSALGLARLTPGQQTPLGTGDTHYNNMPGGAINVTYDGINNASNGFKSGGTSFFTTVPARLGAVEEVSVETGGLGADSGAQSGTNIKFVTKRGTNQYHGSVFYSPRNETFSANTWLRDATGQPVRIRSRFHDFGGNLGGRLVPFGRLKDKLFFFVNFEDSYAPGAVAKTQNVLLSSAQQGVYTYRTTSGAITSANVLQIAAQNGLPTTLDPVVQNLFKQQNGALSGGYLLPLVNDFNRQTLNWADAQNVNDYFPTTRFDYYLTPNIQLTATWNLRHSWNPGTRQWPVAGLDTQGQFRIGGYFIWSGAMNWTITPRTLNEFRYGVQHSGDTIPTPGGRYYTDNGTPYRLNALPLGLNTIVPDYANTTGRHFITTIYDTATLLQGNHSMSMGGTYRKTDWKDTSEILQPPVYNLGLAAGDPASSVFNATTLPGDSNTDFVNAAALYALLTGRLSGISLTQVVDPATLKYGGPVNFTWTRSYMGGVYFQDRWRMTPNFTLNYGLRWEMQGDLYNVSGITAFPDIRNVYGPSVSLFTPGVLSGNNDPINHVGHHSYQPDWINPGPNIGFAWNPKHEEGWRGKLLGGSKTVLRGSYSLVYYDEGSQFFATTAGNNPGKIQTINGTPGQGAVPYGFSLQSVQAGLPPLTAFPPAYTTAFHQSDFTFRNTFSSTLDRLRAPYVISWNFGIQREIARNTVVEVRYTGNQTHRQWRLSNLNEVNVFENGFLKEFTNAQKNLAINNANGHPNNFASFGLPGQTPLPIFETAFGARGTQPALAAASGFTSTSFITALQNGTAGSLANTLATNSTYACRMFGSTFSPCTRFGFDAPGIYPINFFLVNPFSAGSLNIVEDSGWSDYNALQAQVRRQVSSGLQFQANYTFSKSLTTVRADGQNQSINWLTRRNLSLDRQPSPFDMRHVFQTSLVYDLPVGRNRRFAIENRILDTVIGGWTIGSIVTIQSGTPYLLTSGFNTVNQNDSGVVLAPGVTLGQIQDMLQRSQAPFTNQYVFNTALIGPDGRANPKYLLPPTTPGVFGQQLFLYGKNAFTMDASVTKTISIAERFRLHLWAGASNVLNHPIWNIVGANLFGATTSAATNTLNIQSTTFGQVTSPVNTPRSLQFRGTLTF